MVCLSSKADLIKQSKGGIMKKKTEDKVWGFPYVKQIIRGWGDETEKWRGGRMGCGYIAKCEK